MSLPLSFLPRTLIVSFLLSSRLVCPLVLIFLNWLAFIHLNLCISRFIICFRFKWCMWYVYFHLFSCLIHLVFFSLSPKYFLQWHLYCIRVLDYPRSCPGITKDKEIKLCSKRIMKVTYSQVLNNGTSKVRKALVGRLWVLTCVAANLPCSVHFYIMLKHLIEHISHRHQNTPFLSPCYNILSVLCHQENEPYSLHLFLLLLLHPPAILCVTWVFHLQPHLWRMCEVIAAN